jgi:hypothetical protein
MYTVWGELVPQSPSYSIMMILHCHFFRGSEGRRNNGKNERESKNLG